jgi:sporulation protein YqfC
MPKKMTDRFRKWIANKMELPPDVLLDLPRVTIIGQIHIYIENHKGLLSFSDREVRLLLKQGQLLIKGKSFIIKTILPEEILLEGRIDEVLYLKQ